MAIYVSVVSHGHSSLINQLSCLLSLSSNCHVVIKSNIPNDVFDDLEGMSNFHWINEMHNCGFGQNNNIVFNYCRSKLGMSVDDYFIVLNPDVVIEYGQLVALVNNMLIDGVKVAAINLFKDPEHIAYDNSIRKFPSFIQFVRSFIGLSNNSVIDKGKVDRPIEVDWAAGSFLAFKAEHYIKLGGFDEGYFMYCEDVDICYRSHLLGNRVTYYPEIKALHLAKHANRRLFSSHFYWHVISVLRFLLARKGLVTSKESFIE